MKGTVVLISSIHWHFAWQRHQDVASGLADLGYRVIFVEPLPKRWPGPQEWRRVVGRLTGSAATAGLCPQPEHPAVRLVAPNVLPDVGWLAQAVNRHFLVPQLASQLEQMELERPLIVINYLPIRASLALQRALAPDLAVYDCVVDWSNAPFTGDLERVERELLVESDLVLADSPYLVERMQERHANVRQILPAVHFEDFQVARSGNGRAASGIRCAYFGTVGVSIDVDVLRAASHQYNLRIIGPVRGKVSGFSERTEFCGPVPHDRVPELLRDSDVLLLPYSDAPHMPAVIPAKTFECLATGKPTVAIGVPSLDRYADLFYLTESPTEFLEAIAVASEEPAAMRQPRIDFARANSWDRRVLEIEEAMLSELDREPLAQ